MHQHWNDRGEWRFGGRGGPEFGGWGRGGRGGGGRGFGGGAFRVGKMLADGDLRIIVLALLAESPRHGYDIIKALEERSSGIYSPSPGVVYPTLTYLEEVGYVSSASEGNKKVYSISETGRAHLAENRELADLVLDNIEKFGRRLSQARSWWEANRPGGAGTDRDIPDVIPEINDARRELKSALASKLASSVDEQKRVAEILKKAAAEIRAVERKKDEAGDIDLG